MSTAPRRLSAGGVLSFLVRWVMLSALATVFLVLATAPQRNLHTTLSSHGRATTGTVSQSEPDNHDTISYTFVVGGRGYGETDAALPPNPDASHLHPGDHVHVVYDIRDPNLSCACDPRQLAQGDRFQVLLIAGLSIGAILAAGLMLRRARRRRRRAEAV